MNGNITGEICTNSATLTTFTNNSVSVSFVSHQQTKALDLTADALTAAQPVPRAAMVARPAAVPERSKLSPEAKRAPLQVRWPASDVKAAIQLDFPTVSDFMLKCFHDYMKTTNKP
jgi:hypothetical protein